MSERDYDLERHLAPDRDAVLSLFDRLLYAGRFGDRIAHHNATYAALLWAKGEQRYAESTAMLAALQDPLWWPLFEAMREALGLSPIPVSSGTADPGERFTVGDGAVYYRPVKSVSSETLTLALPLGAGFVAEAAAAFERMAEGARLFGVGVVEVLEGGIVRNVSPTFVNWNPQFKAGAEEAPKLAGEGMTPDKARKKRLTALGAERLAGRGKHRKPWEWR